jgi:hypothetical protein
MFESNDRDSTGYKAWRRTRQLPEGAPTDPLRLWVGQRVRLKASEEDGFSEEFGIVEEYQPESKMFTVTVDDEFLVDDHDDGLRELDVDQAELTTRQPKNSHFS